MDTSIELQVVAAIRRHIGAGRLPLGASSLGLDPLECTVLSDSVGLAGPAVGSPPAGATPAPLLQPLVTMLWDHRASDAAWTRLMAGAVGCACFGGHHLWQDLGLSGRGEVSALLMRHFPTLAAANTRGLRWKRHLFSRLGDRLGVEDLAPPRCDGCDDVEVCFAPLGSPSIRIRSAA